MIPPSFSAVALSQDSKTVLPQYFCVLYSTCVACLEQLCRVHVKEFHWVEKMISYARDIAAEELGTVPPLPQGWDTLVDEYRPMMNLFMSVQRKDLAFIWMNICPYLSGLLCLSANSIFEVDEAYREIERRLRLQALDFIEQVSQQINHELMWKVQLACAKLDWHKVNIV